MEKAARGARLNTALELARRAGGMSLAEFADAIGDATNAASLLYHYSVKHDKLFKAASPSGDVRYFETAERAQAWESGSLSSTTFTGDHHVEHARIAVRHIDKHNGANTSSLEGLFAGKGVPATGQYIDALLAPLVDAQRLIRISALRGGQPMFDYRVSSAWSPAATDFDICRVLGDAPVPSVSPVTAPSTKPAPGAHHTATFEDRRASGNTGRERSAASKALYNHFEQAAAAPALGWAMPPAPSPAPCAASAEPIEGARDRVIEPTDLVSAINSRGEMVLDLGVEGLIKFKPSLALELHRFAASMTILEQMAARGEL